MVRVLRSLFALRKKINVAILRRLVHGFYTHSVSQKQTLLAYLDQAAEMDTTESGSPTGPAPPNTRLRGAKSALTPLLPEVDAYLQLLMFLHLSDRGSSSALTCGENLVAKLISYNRRTLDHLAARIYYYYAMAYESDGRASEIRGFLHSRLRTATLRHDFEGQAVLINCLLRSYVSQNLFDQVSSDFERTDTDRSNKSNCVFARPRLINWSTKRVSRKRPVTTNGPAIFIIWVELRPFNWSTLRPTNIWCNPCERRRKARRWVSSTR